MRYAILCNPGHNRVYFEESKLMAAGELSLVLASAREIGGETFGGVYYVTFKTDAPLGKEELAAIAQLSFFYALFEVVEYNCKMALTPVTPPEWAAFGDDLITILKYTGKTNELFTRLLVGAALSAFGANVAVDTRLRLLDPVAGKGTTLFEALTRGLDAFGVEVGDKAARESVQYLKKYLETAKVKHTSHTERVSGANKIFVATRHTIEIAKAQMFEMVSGNSMYADKLFKKNSFHLLVGDLPYGVQHGNVTGEGQSRMTRSPRELLDACLPAWNAVLCKGGGLALAWNTLVYPRADMEQALERNGFEVKHGSGYDGFLHRVDNSIRRDIVAARKVR